MSLEADAIVTTYGSWVGTVKAFGLKAWDSSETTKAARLAEQSAHEQKEKTLS
jgi:hypothetical protein